MKKLVLSLAILLAFALSGVAQEMGSGHRGSTPYYPLVQEANNRQKWNVVYIASNENYPNDYHTEIQSIRDNINLDGLDYKLVWKEDVYDSKRIAGAVREEDKRVYYRMYWQQSYQNEVLLYDFNLTVGDTVSVGWSDYRLIVLEESQVQVNGTMRRQLGLAMYFDDGTTGEVAEYWIEGVGSTYGFLNSGYEGWVGAFVHLLCYHEDDDLLWMNENFSSCVMNSDEEHLPFAPQGAEWYFNVWGFMGDPDTYYHMEVLGDTIIQGHQCRIITRQFLGGNGDEQYVYEDNRVVYWYNQTMQAFTVLYDFNADEGDSWICDVDSCSFQIVVQSVNETVWEGHTYRVQQVISEGEEYNDPAFDGLIIEGIGYEGGLFPYPWACSSSIYCGGYPDYLRCYFVNDEMLYHEGEYDCEEYGFCWDGTVAEAYAGGDGTAENPYQIATSKQLALLAQQTNNGTGGDAYYELTINISLKDCTTGWGHPWISIGTATHPFSGHFNGKGRYIAYLYQNITDGELEPVGGLFGFTDGAEISDVRLDRVIVGGSAQYVGALIGYAGLTNISNCSVSESYLVTDNGIAGGLVGYADVPFGMVGYPMEIEPYYITNCLVNYTSSIEGSECAGGIVGKVNKDDGRNPCVITGCTVWNDGYSAGGSVTSGGDAGGIVGWFRNGTISGCQNQLVVTGETSGVGGIVGTADLASIENCTNQGEISGGFAIGGIVGYGYGNMNVTSLDVFDCVNEGSVTGHDTGINTLVGGIVGFWGSNITRCVNKGDVMGIVKSSGFVGGIVGDSDGIVANCYNRGDVTVTVDESVVNPELLFVGGITATSDPKIYNVYNTGVVTGPELPASVIHDYGNIIGRGLEDSHYLNAYWLYDDDLPACGNVNEPELHGSSAFVPGATSTSWTLNEAQYGTTDLLEALNLGAAVVLDSVPDYPNLCTWLEDVEGTNDGYPVFGPNSAGDDLLEAYCEAPFNFGGSPISDQGNYGAQLWWNKPYSSHWFHYDETPYEGSVYCNNWGIKIPAEEIQAGDVLTHVAFYKAGGQDQTMGYSFAFSFEGETEPDSWDYLPGNWVQVEPGPDGWLMVKLGSPIVCEEGKCLWIVLTAPNVEGNNASYCRASGNPNACWSSEGNAAGDWMIRGYFTNDVGYNEAGYNEELDHYNIYRGRSLDELEKIAEVGRDEEEYFDSLQDPFGDYYYQLTAAYTDGRESVPAKRGENPHDPNYVYFHVGNISSLGSEWYYEIQNENGSITYQHLEYAADTTVSHKDVKIIIRTNTLYDKGEHNEVTKEYIYEDFGKVYWWNNELQDFTLLYDLGAQIGDEWEIKVGTESIIMHVDTVEQYEYEGTTYRMLHVSDANDLFGGKIMSGVGHLTSFFPEGLMTRGKGYRVNGLRCYWIYGDLVFTLNRNDCDAIYAELHNGIEEDGPSTGSGTFAVYPNPTHNILFVQTLRATSLQAETVYRITNLTGQTVLTGQITAETQQIDVSGLPQGMYFITMGDMTRKFVVQ